MRCERSGGRSREKVEDTVQLTEHIPSFYSPSTISLFLSSSSLLLSPPYNGIVCGAIIVLCCCHLPREWVCWERCFKRWVHFQLGMYHHQAVPHYH